VVPAGTQIAAPVSSPYNGIVGNIEAGWADPNVLGRPLAQSLEGYSGDQSVQGLEAGWSWNIFATSLGAPTGTFDGAGAGLAAEAESLATSLIEPLPGGAGTAELVSTAGAVPPASPSGGVSLSGGATVELPQSTASAAADFPSASGSAAGLTPQELALPLHGVTSHAATAAQGPGAEPGFRAAPGPSASTHGEPTFKAQ
jgi:hypothetical protein